MGRSLAKPKSSGKCWLRDLARMCRKVDFPSTVLVVFSCSKAKKGRRPYAEQVWEAPSISGCTEAPLSLHCCWQCCLLHEEKKALCSYLCEEVDFEACCFAGLGLPIVQVVSHGQHKLQRETTVTEQHRQCPSPLVPISFGAHLPWYLLLGQ